MPLAEPHCFGRGVEGRELVKNVLPLAEPNISDVAFGAPSTAAYPGYQELVKKMYCP